MWLRIWFAHIPDVIDTIQPELEREETRRIEKSDSNLFQM